MILGIDYGHRRWGIAIAKGEWVFPRQPLIVSSFDDAIEQLRTLIEAEDIEEIVFGNPLSLSGNDSAMSQEIERVARRVEKMFNLPVHLMDERWSTKETERLLHLAGKRAQEKKELKDSLSAKLLLEVYVASRRLHS